MMAEDANDPAMQLLENASILTPTSGFLEAGYTHTINVYQGCAFAGSLCGTYCYAQHNQWITKGRSWGLYGAKRMSAKPTAAITTGSSGRNGAIPRP